MGTSPTEKAGPPHNNAYMEVCIMDFGIGVRNSDVKRYEIKDLDGKTVGSFTIRKKQNNVKKKKSGYDYRELSNRVLMAKTPYSAGQAATVARTKIAALRRKLYTGVYDDKELKSEIAHAQKMERAAKKRLKNLQNEELEQQIQRRIEKEREINSSKAKAKKSSKKAVSKEKRERREKELSEKEIRELMGKIDKTLNSVESEKAGPGKKSRESEGAALELERKRKKHRLEEMQDIMKADMEYLRSKLDKLEREKIQAEAESNSGNNCESGMECAIGMEGSGDMGGVLLEIGGVDMTVPASQAPASGEGICVDVSL